MNTHDFSLTVGQEELIFRTGGFARQAGGAVMVQYGETIVFTAATASSPREGLDFFPLTVDYREKTAAAGKFPGGYFKREGRPSEKEILVARMTDRPIRPLFPEGFRNDVQVIAMLLSADGVNESDVLAMNAASAALTISPIPFGGPIGTVRVGLVDDEFVINPPHPVIGESNLDMIYTGTGRDPLMIEGSAHEVTEEQLVEAMRLAQAEVTRIVEVQERMRDQLGKPPMEYTPVVADPELVATLDGRFGDRLEEVLFTTPGKQDRIAAMRGMMVEAANVAGEVEDADLRRAFEAVEKKRFRGRILGKEERVDGRGPKDLRPLSAEVGILPRTHGSAIFTRGETQALALTTLGSRSDTQDLDALTGGIEEKRFMLHYSFPHFSVGETGMIRGPGRREIGHGALAERSIAEAMPEDFPYTVRVNSEILESNGSSSMATVCAGTLSLMDAGVPMRAPVAGISVGLVSDDNRNLLLTDILGVEDHLGDMDFKVAGTPAGITGFQLDLKLPGVPMDVIVEGLQQARDARGKLIDLIRDILPEPRSEMSRYAPRIQKVSIDPEKIGLLIGPGGKNIRRITETSGCSIDVEDTGDVFVFSSDAAGMEIAVEEINKLTAEVEIGKLYHGRVVSVKEFGAFIELLPGKDGLCHISELADFRVNRTEDVANIGDEVWVKVLDIDERGRVRLSRRAAMEERGETEPRPEGTQDREPRRERDGDRARDGGRPRDRDRPRGGDRGGRSSRGPR